MMKNNVGETDKLIRILISMVILGYGIYLPSFWGLLSIIPLMTGISSLCPVYSLLGVNTCRTETC